MEGGGDDLVLGRVRQQVSGQLLDRELVEGLVLVEGLDHPVAISPDDASRVARVAGAVGIAGEIEPLAGPVFAIGGLGEEVGDDFGVRGLGQPRDFLRRGREAGDVERDAADEDMLGRFGRPLQSFLLLAFGQEGVDGVGFAVLRYGRTNHGLVGPVTAPGRALPDPFLEQCELGGRDGLVLLGRRHYVVGVRRFDALDEFALLRLARQDDEVSLAVALGVLFVVEPQFSFAAFLIRSVAGDAVLGKDRADLTAEVDRFGRADGAEDDAEEEGGLGGHGDGTVSEGRGFPVG